MAKGKGNKDGKTFKSTSGEHLLGVRENPKVKATSRSEKPVDPVQQKNDEIAQERQKVISKVKPSKANFPIIHVEGDERLNWVSKEMAQFFGFESCGGRDGITRWDFPKAIGDNFKRHTVFRQYAYKQIMVDVFDKGTPKKEILRIKAHLENLGYTYTYIVGGEPGDVPMEKYIKLVFTKRMEKSNQALLKKNTPPQSLSEAGFAGHSVESR